MLEDITFQEWNTKYLLNLIKSVMKRRLFALSARTTPGDCLQLQVTWHYFCFKKNTEKINTGSNFVATFFKNCILTFWLFLKISRLPLKHWLSNNSTYQGNYQFSTKPRLVKRWNLLEEFPLKIYLKSAEALCLLFLFRNLILFPWKDLKPAFNDMRAWEVRQESF